MTNHVLSLTFLAMLGSTACSTAPVPRAEIRTETYAVADLLQARGGREVSTIKLEDLVENLQAATDPSYWDASGHAMRADGPDRVQVAASPEMHAKVAMVLDDIRRSGQSRQ